MKREKMTMLLGKLQEKGVYRNDGKGRLYRYDSARGVWVVLAGVQGRRQLSEDVRKEGTDLRVGELDGLLGELRENIDFTEPRLANMEATTLIAVSNGVVDLETGTLQKHDPKLFLRNALNFTYQENVTELPSGSAWHDFARTSLGIKEAKVEDANRWTLFKEAAMYALSSLGNAKKMIILLGPPNSGKSVVLEFLEKIVDESAWMPLTFSDLCHRFRSSMMEGVPLIICDEMPLTPLKKLDVIKKVISSNPVIVESKGVDPKKCRPMAKIVYAANNLPVLAEPDVGGAFAERLLLLPFVDRKNVCDPNLVKKLWEDRDSFLSLAVKTMPRFIKSGLCFSLDEVGERILKEFKSNSFSLKNFVDECCVLKAGNRLCLSDFYSRYTDFCTANMVMSVPRAELKADLAQLGFPCQKQRFKKGVNAMVCVIGLDYKALNEEDSEAVVAGAPSAADKKGGAIG